MSRNPITVASSTGGLSTTLPRALRLRGMRISTAEAAPAHWNIRLPDLRSRLLAAPAVAVGPPDDALLAAILVMGGIVTFVVQSVRGQWENLSVEFSAGIQDLLNQKVNLVQDFNRDKKYEANNDPSLSNYRRGTYYTVGLRFNLEPRARQLTPLP